MPINPNIQMGLPQQMPNSPQNEDTSKKLFFN